MTAQTPRAWLVDLDGTLYHAGAVKLKMALELGTLGLHRARLLSQFRHAHEELRAEQAQDLRLSFQPSPFEEQLQRTASRSGRSVAQLRSVVNEWMIERPSKWLKRHRREALVQEIRAFVAQGGHVAVVSDYPVAKKIKALELDDLFSHRVANGETLGLTRLKPSPDGYLLAARMLQCHPEECLVIGDRDDADGAAARAAGMQFRLIKS